MRLTFKPSLCSQLKSVLKLIGESDPNLNSFTQEVEESIEHYNQQPKFLKEIEEKEFEIKTLIFEKLKAYQKRGTSKKFFDI